MKLPQLIGLILIVLAVLLLGFKVIFAVLKIVIMFILGLLKFLLAPPILLVAILAGVGYFLIKRR